MMFSDRRLGDYEWLGPLVNAVGGVVGGIIKATQTQPGAAPTCPTGYIYRPELGGCVTPDAYAAYVQSHQQAAAGGAAPIDPKLILGGVAGLGLVALLLSRR